MSLLYTIAIEALITFLSSCASLHTILAKHPSLAQQQHGHTHNNAHTTGATTTQHKLYKSIYAITIGTLKCK